MITMIDEVYKAAMKYWGIEKQRIKAIEELSELQKELCKSALGESNQNSIAEEIADVSIMIDQMIYAYGLEDDVRGWIRYKTDRLQQRLIENGCTIESDTPQQPQPTKAATPEESPSAEEPNEADNQEQVARPYFKKVPVAPKSEAKPKPDEPVTSSGDVEKTLGTYTGFLFLRCPKCGVDRGFFTREEVETAKCRNCQTEFRLTNMYKMRTKCKCGKHIVYRTNIEDSVFVTYKCFVCGNLVDLEWNYKKQQYETV